MSQAAKRPAGGRGKISKCCYGGGTMADIINIAISLVPGLSLNERILLEEAVSDLDDFASLGINDIEQLLRKRLRGRESYPAHRSILERAEEISRRLVPLEARAVSFWDREYPPQLRKVKTAPYLLYIRGSFPDPELPQVAIVGTRRPSEKARQAAFRLAAEFCLIGIPVVSGLAYGIDAAAHWGAVKTHSATVAVLGTGIDHVYPRSNRTLAWKILEYDGAVISEKPPASRIGTYDFPMRNRIIAALARGVILVQAPERSGALITAEWAAQYDRQVYVHASGLEGDRGKGTRSLASDLSGACTRITPL
ncbi:MAG TPA: DNA-protecting protein DprA, partial [Sediminispirochaeta sp.]|nr:DNA-protecting protein DprA [Sediminispirochaeta sp.]